MRVCAFIKLHITAQSGPVILVILCHSHWSSQGGINDTCYENLWSDATKGTHSLYLYKSYLSPEHPVLPPLLPCCSLKYPGWQLLNQPFLFCIFFAFHPSCLPRFPHGVHNYFAVSCAFSPPFRPPQSYSRSRYRRPRSHPRYNPRFSPRSRPRSHPVFVYGYPPPTPSPSCAPSFTSTTMLLLLLLFPHISPISRTRGHRRRLPFPYHRYIHKTNKRREREEKITDEKASPDLIGGEGRGKNKTRAKIKAKTRHAYPRWRQINKQARQTKYQDHTTVDTVRESLSTPHQSLGEAADSQALRPRSTGIATRKITPYSSAAFKSTSWELKRQSSEKFLCVAGVGLVHTLGGPGLHEDFSPRLYFTVPLRCILGGPHPTLGVDSEGSAV